MNNTKIIARKSLWNANVELLVRQGDSVLISPVFEKVEQGLVCEPSFRMDITETQVLMDSLWDCGFRPSEGAGSAGAMKAVENHLQDMRSLVFENKSERSK